MANHKSALKRNKQTIKKTARNKAVRTNLRTNVKRLRDSISTKDKDKATELLKTVTVKLDKAVTKNILHKNAASRTVSRLSKQVHSL